METCQYFAHIRTPSKKNVQPFYELAKKWDETLYWNGNGQQMFWNDCLDVIFREKVSDVKITVRSNNLRHGILSKIKNPIKNAPEYELILFSRKEQRVSMLILDEQKRLVAKIDEWQKRGKGNSDMG